MKICGVELRAREAIFCMVKTDAGPPEVLDLPTRKIELKDSKHADQVRSVFGFLQTFLREHAPDVIVIKQRNERGQFAGGAVTFKLEGLIQVATTQAVEFLAPVSISHALKRKRAVPPESIFGYQEEAFRTALAFYHRQNG